MLNILTTYQRTMSSIVGALERVWPFNLMHITVQIYNALIQPHLDYRSFVLEELNGNLSNKLQKRATRASLDSSTIPVPVIFKKI